METMNAEQKLLPPPNEPLPAEATANPPQQRLAKPSLNGSQHAPAQPSSGAPQQGKTQAPENAPQQGQPKTEEKPPEPAQIWTIVLIALGIIVPLTIFLIIGSVQRWQHKRELAAEAAKAASAPPRVIVVHPMLSPNVDWSVPGTTQAFQDATIYARLNGYLRKRYVDIGDSVKAGQLLAEIEAPEVEQQLNEARANLQQSIKQVDLQKANLVLAKVTMDRDQSLVNDGAVSKQVVDQSVAAYDSAKASVAAAQATVDSSAASVRQYEAMTSFERVLAPFEGVVTQRNVDVGALITAGSPVNNTSAAPTSVSGAPTGLFQVSQTDTLRVFVNLPQVVAKNVKIGMPAQVTTRGALNSPVASTVARTAAALDPNTRTLLTEVDIPNASHALFPGEFVYAAFKIGASGERWNLPATALIFDSNGTQVMIIEADEKLRIQKVTVGRDYGDTIDIQSGLTGGERIVKQPDVSLQAGQIVTPVDPPKAPTK